MTGRQILLAARACLDVCDEALCADHPSERLEHLLYMTMKITDWVRQGRLDKAQRWLGFVQGVLWAEGLASIDQCKRMNMREVE